MSDEQTEQDERTEQDAPDEPTPDTSDRPERDSSGSRVEDPAEDAEDSGRSRSRSRSSSKRGGQRRPRSNKGKGRRPRKSSYRAELTQTLTMIGVTVATFDQFDGTVIIANAESTARKLDEAAQQSDAIARALEALTSGGTGIAAVIVGLAPIVLPIAWNHGLVPDLDIIAGMAPPAAQGLSRRRDKDQAGAGDGAAGPSAPSPADLEKLAESLNGLGLDTDAKVTVARDGAG